MWWSPSRVACKRKWIDPYDDRPIEEGEDAIFTIKEYFDNIIDIKMIGCIMWRRQEAGKFLQVSVSPHLYSSLIMINYFPSLRKWLAGGHGSQIEVEVIVFLVLLVVLLCINISTKCHAFGQMNVDDSEAEV
jgi:hypothetical protein